MEIHASHLSFVFNARNFLFCFCVIFSSLRFCFFILILDVFNRYLLLLYCHELLDFSIGNSTLD
jgi:hypothetical protein